MKICRTCRHCYEDTDSSCEEAGHGSLVADRPGVRLIADKYRLDRRIGEGAMGAVYECTHIKLYRPQVIKILLHRYTTDEQMFRRFQREARETGKLEHPGIVRIHDHDRLDTGEAYIVMELVNGKTLEDYIREKKQLPFDEAVDIAEQAAQAIHTAHLEGIIHRDLKPSNIMLARDYKGDLLVKILDFGIAKLTEQASITGGGIHTEAGKILGTPHYMSPEQCEGDRELTPQSDIYSLGVILYEMIAGQPPFLGPNSWTVMKAHSDKPVPPISKSRKGVPAALAEVIRKTLFKLPSARPQSAAELARMLRDSKNPAAVAPSTVITNGKITFSRRWADNWDIYVMDPDGTNQTRLTHLSIGSADRIAPQSNQPTWSPDGAKIAFTTTLHGHFEIYVVNADGSNLVRLTDTAESSSEPAWSPDGARIAFVRGGGPTAEIYVMNADGANQIRLTDNDRQDGRPTWSPDATRIAFHSVGANDNFRIYLINADGSHPRSITDARMQAVHPDWEPGGKRIAFKGWGPDPSGKYSGGIYVIESDGSDLKLLLEVIESDYPAWSPDAQKIAFAIGNGVRGDIYTMDADGRNQIRLTRDSGGCMEPDWQPVIDRTFR